MSLKFSKSATKTRVIASITITGEKGKDEKYFYNIPRQTMSNSIEMTREIAQANASDKMSQSVAGARLFINIIDGITPATDRGTALPFAKLVEQLGENADELIRAITTISEASIVDLKSDPDVEVIED